MKSPARAGLALAAILAAGAAGYGAGQGDVALSLLSRLHAVTGLETAASARAGVAAPPRPVAYYRDPDGRDDYSAEPKKTADGRDYLPVYTDEDTSFESKPEPASESAAKNGAKKLLYYRNPMGLPDTSPVPKKDSMGMDYIPVYAGEDEDATTVRVAPGRLQQTGVRSELVERRTILAPVHLPGTVALDERRVAVVATRSDAYVDKVENVTTGDKVKKGEPLLYLYSPDIAAAGAQVVAFPGFDGSQRRLENLNVSAQVIADIARTRKVPLSIAWPSPLDGVVLERKAVEGMKAAAGDVLFRIADLSVLWILADVPEHDLASIAPGQMATIRVRGLPSRTFAGRVAMIYPQVAQDTRTTKVRIELGNPDGLLRPDMYADVEIASGSGGPVIAVPDSAVIDTGTRQVVILDKGEGRFEPREVKIGRQGGGFTEIRSGIAAGDKVVTAANFLIDAESNLQSALKSLSAAGTP
jgi:Cu(I)/Ag(I) efflux system membrane fusion protein